MKHSEKNIILKRFPPFELSYGKTIHNKVYSDIVLAIPYGKKYYAWFSYYKKDFVCFFLEIGRDNTINTISIHPVCFHKDLAKNTILTAAGTVVLGRGVHQSIQRHDNVLHPWKDTRHLFSQSDINILNFKSPLLRNSKQPTSRWRLIGDESYIKGLTESKIDLVSISGNHMGDAGVNGLVETIEIFQNNGINTVGAGVMNDAYSCRVLSVGGNTFGFLGFNNVQGSIRKATNNRVGIAWLDQDALLAVERCEKKVDHLIVMVNWGIEYVAQPRDIEKKWAQQLIRHGADVILGDQAHWVQNHSFIQDSFVAYGLGNYIFDQHWSAKTTEGIMVKLVYYESKLLFVDARPIKLKSDGTVHELLTSDNRYSHVIDAFWGNNNY